MDRVLAAQLLKQFPNATLPTKVLIAAALYAASKELTEEEKEQIKEMWARAIRIEIEVEHIADLYAQGLADYTDTLREYGDVTVFIVKTLARALRGS